MSPKTFFSPIIMIPVLAAVYCTAANAGTCGGAQTISTIAKDNGTLQLANGSKWQIARPDLIDGSAWHPNALILTCDETLVNLDINEDTVARRLQ